MRTSEQPARPVCFQEGSLAACIAGDRKTSEKGDVHKIFMWLSGYRPHRTCWWGDRVNALARLSGGLVIGTPPGNAWTALPARTDPLPRRGGLVPDLP